MRTFTQSALTASIAAALLAGCGSQPTIAPGAMPQSRAIATTADRGESWMLRNDGTSILKNVNKSRRDRNDGRPDERR